MIRIESKLTIKGLVISYFNINPISGTPYDSGIFGSYHEPIRWTDRSFAGTSWSRLLERYKKTGANERL
jgi:hypothetical protein